MFIWGKTKRLPEDVESLLLLSKKADTTRSLKGLSSGPVPFFAPPRAVLITLETKEVY